MSRKHRTPPQFGTNDMDAIDVAEAIVEAGTGVPVEERHPIRPTLRKRKAFEVGPASVLAHNSGAGGEHNLEGPVLGVPR